MTPLPLIIPLVGTGLRTVLLIVLGAVLGVLVLAFAVVLLGGRDRKGGSAPAGEGDEEAPFPDEEPPYIEDGGIRYVSVPDDPDDALPEVVDDVGLMDDAFDHEYWDKFAALPSLPPEEREAVVRKAVDGKYLSGEAARRLLEAEGAEEGEKAPVIRNSTVGFYDDFAGNASARDLGGVFDEEYVMAPVTPDIRRMVLGGSTQDEENQ